MSIITVNNLSKRYRIGTRGRGWDSGLRHALTDMVTRPFRRGKKGADDETEFWALKDVSFEVQEGEVLGIIGRNGAGKSTLLKILSRITWPTSGEVRIRGRVASLLEVGTGFHPELTGRENIYLNGSILGMTRAEVRKKFDEIVDFSEIEKFLDTPVKRYSSGMYVRLAFAVAAHLDPEILLVDEVLAVGDAAFQKKCLGKMGDVAKGGRTVLFVSHNMAAVEGLCGRCIILCSGAVFFSGDKREATKKYLDGFQHKSKMSLALRNDRTGNNLLKIIDIAVGLKSNTQCGHWRTGDDCVIWFRYYTDSPVAHIDIGFSIIDSSGRGLLFANTVVSKQRIFINDKSGVIFCIIESLALSPGEYYISYDTYCNGELLDKLEHACKLIVEPRDGAETWSAWGGYATICTKYEWGHG